MVSGVLDILMHAWKLGGGLAVVGAVVGALLLEPQCLEGRGFAESCQTRLGIVVAPGEGAAFVGAVAGGVVGAVVGLIVVALLRKFWLEPTDE
jgi:hypothetical protein